MKRLIAAFGNSVAGLRHNFANETAIRQEIILIAFSLPLAPFIATSGLLLIAMWSSLLMLLAIELLNTGLERLSDRVTTERDPLIKIVKDSGSAAVLMATLVAAQVWGYALWQFFTTS